MYVRLSDIQQELYRACLKRSQGARGGSGKGIMSDLTYLSKIVSHPQMLRLERKSHSKARGRTSPADDATSGRTSPAEDLDDSTSPRPTSPDMSDEKWWEDVLPDVSDDIQEDIASSPKLAVLLELIALCLKQKEKMLIFSKSTAMLDVVQRLLCATPHPDPSADDMDAVKSRAAASLGSNGSAASAGPETAKPLWQENKHFCRLDGSTESKRRQLLCNQFNNSEYESGGCSVFLISTTAGVLSRNLGCFTVKFRILP
jgi:SNF2 family DNA or RNA helicase